MQFKILTYNLHKGFTPLRKKFKLRQMRDALVDEQADIVFLQEVQGEHLHHQARIHNWMSEPHLDYLAGEYWPYKIYAKNAYYPAGHHGNGLLSQYPVFSWENINLSANRLASRSLLSAKLQLKKIKMQVICVHLGLFERERRRQLAILVKYIQSNISDEQPLIVAGDFNDWRRTADHYLPASLHLKEAFMEKKGKHPKTFPALYPTLALDRVYYRGLSLVDCACLNDPVWQNLSDHLPLRVEFSLP